MIMELPKASRTVKRTIDLVHLFAASVWLGGFAVLFVLTLSDGAALGLAGLDAPVAIDAFRSQFIVPCIPFLMATAVLYGVLTSWGFAKHNWLVAKWVLSIVVIVGFALLPLSTATVGAMLVCIVALFALSVFKPGMKKSKKAKAKNLD